MKQKNFYGSRIELSVIRDYYPVSAAKPDSKKFDHFTCLYQFDNNDADDGKNDFGLVVYAIGKNNGEVLNGKKPINVIPLPYVLPPGQLTGKKITHANIDIFPSVLKKLYTTIATSDLYLYPFIYPLDTPRVTIGLDAQTSDPNILIFDRVVQPDKSGSTSMLFTQTTAAVRINPCPPAQKP